NGIQQRMPTWARSPAQPWRSSRTAICCKTTSARSKHARRSIGNSRMTQRISAAVLGLALAVSVVYALSAQAPASDGPNYVAGTNNLLRPADYREWIFLGSSLGLNYPAPGAAPGPASFNNV